MLNTASGIPATVAYFLREQEEYIDRGNLKRRARYYPVLDRYVTLLEYGFNFEVDKGNKHWQKLESARTVRDYYTHLDVNDPRSITSTQVLEFMESVLLGIIWPCSEIQRTLLLQIYFVYQILAELRELVCEYVEQPLMKDWPSGDRYIFWCPFDNVDMTKFSNT